MLSLIFYCSITLATPKIGNLTLDKIDEAMSTGPRLVVMWSLDCPACFIELKIIEEMLVSYPALPISLIATDDDGERLTQISDIYQRPALANIPRWIFATNQQRSLRYHIDLTWQGELPRSYYIDKNGKRHGHSGLLSKQQIKKLLLPN